jgi:3'-5' exoribonuclease-like protein
VRIFYDCEFLENGRTIDLISIGMVAHTDVGGESTYYAVNDALLREASDLHQCVIRHSWLMNNVVPHLPLKGHPSGNGPIYQRAGDPPRSPRFVLDPDHEDVLPLRIIKREVREFVMGWEEEPELWAWYGAYDHVALCQLFGTMMDLPKGFPMWTNDVRTLAMLAGKDARSGAPAQESQEHHALNDARHDRDLYEHYAPLVDVRRLA